MEHHGIASTSVLFRSLALGALIAGPAAGQFRAIDGSGNNLGDPEMGSAETPLMRLTQAAYADGQSAPAGADRPSAREVSNALAAQSHSVPNALGASDFVWQWGQFLDHDIDLTPEADPCEAFDIEVPLGDVHFDPLMMGTVVIPLCRSVSTDVLGVREQLNLISTWIDGSNVYGSDAQRARELRTMDGTGRLKVTQSAVGDLMPFNVNGLPNAGGTDATLFLGGDVRANEQVGLTAMHTLFVREHNFWAGVWGVLYPFFPGEIIYEFARASVGAELQIITYNEFLPALLGPGALAPYAGYDPQVDGRISNFFSTASYRFGHSLLNEELKRLSLFGQPFPEGNLALKDAFFNPQELLDHGIDPLLRGMAKQACQAADTKIVDAVRNFLFGPPGAGGFDLASLNIQRGRDHGLASYNEARLSVGLAPVTSFAEITSDPTTLQQLQSTYDTVDDIDGWVGGLAEDPVPGALVGELVREVLIDQFTRLRSGDRYWYQNYLPPLHQLVFETQTLSSIIQRNTSINFIELQANVFAVPSADS